jgi:hypothetical protein
MKKYILLSLMAAFAFSPLLEAPARAEVVVIKHHHKKHHHRKHHHHKKATP